MRGATPLIRLAVGAIVGLVLVGVLVPSAAAGAAPAWAQLADPFASPPVQSGFAAFGAAGLAVVGDGGTMAVSSNGGATWSARATNTTVNLRGVSFINASAGWAVGPAGAILATTDGGATWNPQTATVDLSAIDLHGVAFSDASHGWAVGTAGTIIATIDGGATWNPQTSNVTVDLNGVAFKNASNGWAVGAGGTILTTSDGGTTWNPLTSTSPPTQDLAGVAYLGSPRPQWLVGGQGGLLERFVLSSAAWTSDTGALSADIVSCAAGLGGVAYALSSNGHVEQTLSYGAAPLSLAASTTALRAGRDVRLTVSSPIRAPGTLLLEEQTVGGSWQRVATWPWSTSPATPGDVLDEPLSTTSYRLRFVFSGHTAATSDAATVGVQPKISLTHTSLSLRKGSCLSTDRPRLSHRDWSQGHHLDQPRRQMAPDRQRRRRRPRPRHVVCHEAVRHAHQGELQAAGAHGRRAPKYLAATSAYVKVTVR